MKKSFIVLALLAAMGTANAVTTWVNGTLYGNVCRAGLYYTVYPVSASQPVGSFCPVRDGLGNIILTGTVTNE